VQTGEQGEGPGPLAGQGRQPRLFQGARTGGASSPVARGPSGVLAKAPLIERTVTRWLSVPTHWKPTG